MSDQRVQSIEQRVLMGLEDTSLLARDLLPQLTHRQVIGLQGDMGAGKTHFVKALARELGVSEEQINSPSFAIHQQYLAGDLTIHHLDLFRLETVDEIESSGLWDLFYDDNVIIIIEWIDRISEQYIPQHFSYLRLDWQVLGDGRRRVDITFFRSVSPKK